MTTVFDRLERQSMKTITLAALVMFMTLSVPSLQAGPPPTTETQQAHLSGVVLDSNEARIAKAKLTIERGHETRTVITNDDGTYKIDLLPGLYQIRVTAQGFCPATRAGLKLRPTANVTMNFVVVDCALEYVLTFENDKFKGDVDRYKMPFKEESFFLGSQSSPPLNLFVQFGERLESNGVIQYKGFKLSGDRQVGATLTYNLLTLHANTICLDKRKFHIEANGSVVVENGERTLRGDRVSLQFDGDQPIIRVGF
jgi:hypothetical protein